MMKYCTAVISKRRSPWSLALAIILLPTAALSQGTGNDQMMADIALIIFNFFVLAVIFEVALTPIFNWSVFLGHLEGKGWKTPITIGMAWLTIAGTDLNILVLMMNAMGGGALKYPLWGTFLSALLIAGGSSGINEIFSKLGIRNPAKVTARAKRARAKVERARQETAEAEPLVEAIASPSLAYDMVFNKATNSLTCFGRTWKAVTLAHELPAKVYTVPPRSLMIGDRNGQSDPPVPHDDKYKALAYGDGNDFHWFLWLGENNLGIHPDGKGDGTAGCIGVQDADTRPLYEALKHQYAQSLTVLVVEG